MISSLKQFLLLIFLVSPVAGYSPTGSVQVTTPQRIAISLGWCGADAFTAFGSSSGLVVRVEPGICGGKVHLGFRSAFNLFIPMVSMDITGSLLRTWYHPWGGVQAGQTFAGLESRLGLRYFVVTAGYYRHIAGNGSDHPIGSFGIGIGL